jgi:enoyl-CoA hydratase/carnithine racemase
MAIQLTRIDEFAVVTLNRPDALNALSFALIRDLGHVLDEVASSDARALLVTGAGPKAFCAGADIKELTGRSLLEQKRGAELGQSTFAKIERLSMPSVAVINGYAFGGVGRALATPLAEGLKIEADLSTLAYQTRDAVEGMQAFIDKRKPRFSDE